MNIEQIKKTFAARNLHLSSITIEKLLYHQIVVHKRKVKIITLVRDPINRNISAYFENLNNLLSRSQIEHYHFDTYAQAFLERYPHHVPLEWFDKEPREVLGMDIFDHPFPKEKGILTIRKDNIDWLILKAEIDDRVKESAIKDFLELPAFSLTRTNVSKDKAYARAYVDFKRSIVLPQSYLDQMRDAKYTQHFYTKSELSTLWSRWL